MDKPGAKLARSLDAAANTAFEHLGRYEATIEVAGHIIRLEFAGELLRDQMMRPFVHLISPWTEPTSLTVSIWDGRRSEVNLPAGIEPFMNHKPVTYPQAIVSQGGIGLFDPFESTFSFLDLSTSRGYFCVPDAMALRESLLAAPVRSVISWWLQTKGYIPLHAGVIGEGGVGLALCGHSGVGKSTTSLACAEAGMEIAGDDYCLVGTREGELRAYSLFSSGKIYDRHLSDLPAVQAVVINPARPEQEKAISYLTESPAFRMVASLSLRAIVVLVGKGGKQPQIRPISPRRALLLLAPSTLLGFPGTGQANMTSLRAMTESLPCFELELAANLHSNPSKLRELLQSVSHQE